LLLGIPDILLIVARSFFLFSGKNGFSGRLFDKLECFEKIRSITNLFDNNLFTRISIIGIVMSRIPVLIILVLAGLGSSANISIIFENKFRFFRLELSVPVLFGLQIRMWFKIIRKHETGRLIRLGLLL